jgi:hypothetical protein
MNFYDPFNKNNHYYNTYVPCAYAKNVYSPSPRPRPTTVVDYFYDYETTKTSVTPPPSPLRAPRSHLIVPTKFEYIYEEEHIPKLRRSYPRTNVPKSIPINVKEKVYDVVEDFNSSFEMRSDSLSNPLYPDLLYQNKLYKPVSSLSMDDNNMNQPTLEVEEDEYDYYESSHRSLSDSRANLKDKIREARVANKSLFDDFKEKLFIEHRSRRRHRVSLRHRLKSIFGI